MGRSRSICTVNQCQRIIRIIRFDLALFEELIEILSLADDSDLETEVKTATLQALTTELWYLRSETYDRVISATGLNSANGTLPMQVCKAIDCLNGSSQDPSSFHLGLVSFLHEIVNRIPEGKF